RDHAVADVIVGGELAHRAEGAFAPAPEAIALGGVAGDLEDAGAALGADGGDGGLLAGQGGGEAFDLDQQPRGGVGRVAGVERAAAVLADVAADGAGFLAGRVGYVVQAIGRGRLGQVEVDHAGLDDGAPVVGVDLQDAVHAAEGDQDAAADGDGPAAEAGAGA